MQNKPSKWVPGFKHSPRSSNTQAFQMGLFLNVPTGKFEPIDSSWDNVHSGGLFISGANKIYFRDETNKDTYINSPADDQLALYASTVLIAKDRVTGHNPAAVLYTSHSYYGRLRGQ